MGTSYVEFREQGFWTRDGLLEVWLHALAASVSDDSAPWLLEARMEWHTQAHVGFMGWVSAGLDEIVTSPERVGMVLELSQRARRYLTAVAGGAGLLPASWLDEQHIGGPGSGWKALKLEYVLQVADAVDQLLRGQWRGTPQSGPFLPQRADRSDFVG